jgi:hypothetical protein
MDHTKEYMVVLGDLVVIVLVIGSKFLGFKPGLGRWIFKGDKNSVHAFFSEGK